MKIILLSGKPSTGKTTTLNILYDDLYCNKKVKLIEPKQKLGNNPKDFECVISYLDKEVAIYSMGDFLFACIEAIVKYANKDFLVLAYSDRFANNLATIIQNTKIHVIINKTINNNFDSDSIINELEQ